MPWMIVGGIVVATAVATQFGALHGNRPADLGVQDGRLKPPSQTRNSVSSQADMHPAHPQQVYARIEPLPLKPGDAAASMSALRAVLAQTPGVTVITERPDYVYAEAETRWMKFVDDVEFWVNPTKGVIDVRSASRLGREDFGANRTRIDSIRARYLAHP